MDDLNILSEFVDSERSYYDSVDNNRFTFSLGQPARYYRFLLILAERHADICKDLRISLKEYQESVKNSADSSALFERVTLLSSKAQLDIESFYIFGKIFLDKIAHFLEDYFGSVPVKGVSLRSHDRFVKAFEKFRTAKVLVYPADFYSKVTFLKTHLCDYRDKQIEHFRNPRAMRLAGLTDDGKTHLGTTYIYPTVKDLEAVAQSRNIYDLFDAIKDYSDDIIWIIKENRGRSRLKLKNTT